MTREVQTSPNIGIRIGQAIPIQVRRSSVAIGRIARIAADVRNGIRRIHIGTRVPFGLSCPVGWTVMKKGLGAPPAFVQGAPVHVFHLRMVRSGRGRPSRIEHKGQTSPNSGSRIGQAMPSQARRPSAAIGRIARRAADARNGSRSGCQILIIAETCG